MKSPLLDEGNDSEAEENTAEGECSVLSDVTSKGVERSDDLEETTGYGGDMEACSVVFEYGAWLWLARRNTGGDVNRILPVPCGR